MNVKKYEENYAPKSDMTFVTCDTYEVNLETKEKLLISTEVVGFYFGEPQGDATKMYHNKGTRLVYDEED